MLYITYISSFLNTPGVEGPQQLIGYIPCKPGNFTGKVGQDPARYVAIGASGVTAATGADFGQTDAETLEGYGISSEIVNTVRPYLGLKKAAAIQQLAQHPLRLTQDAADEIDHCLHRGYAALVEKRYNRENPRTQFTDLPEQAQAVIFSLLYQKGCTGGPNTSRNTWAAFVRGDWEDASRRLCNKSLWDAYQLRRSIEGKCLKELL